VQLSAFITLTLHKTARKNTALISTLVAMAVNTAVPQSTPKKSWADIVKGRSEAKVAPLRPAAHGTHRCLCTGEFLVMLGHYGWIMALQDIDHPEADRHGGRIYLRASDLRPGYKPKQGDEVTFFLYADENGLGAEDCFSTHDPHPPQPPTPPRQQRYSQPKTNWGIRAQHSETTKKSMNAQAQAFVPTVLVPLNSNDEKASVDMNPAAKEFVPAPPGLGPSLSADATEFIPSCSNQSGSPFCAFNAKRFHDEDSDSDSDTESTVSGSSGRVLVAPGLTACFVSDGKPEQWSTLSSRCAQTVMDVDTDSDSSWCDDETDDHASFALVQNRAEEWAAVSARCAQAVGQVHHEHPWHVRNAAAKAKLTANVGDDIRWDVVFNAIDGLDGRASVPLPPGLAPPGLAPPAPPGLA
jgi:hypothetical protein